MRSRAKHVLVRLVPLVALALVGVAVAVASILLDSPFDESAFNRTTWLEMVGEIDPDNPRGGMASALIEELESEKPSRDAVLHLLGPSEYPCSSLSPPIGPAETCLSYNLGMWSGMRLDYDTLDIYFDGKSHVARALTVQH